MKSWDRIIRWLTGTELEARQAAERTLPKVSIGLPAANEGNPNDPKDGVDKGGTLAALEKGTHGTALGFLTSDCFLAEYDRDAGKAYALDDKGERHPGHKGWKKGDSLFFLGDEPGSGPGLVVRSAEFGTEGLYKNFFLPSASSLIAHHLPPKPPQNSSQVYDPDETGRHGGLHYPLRVRQWIRFFCSKYIDRGAKLFAPLFNLGRNGDGTPAYGASHWDRGEGTLSDEGGGPLANANDGNHVLGRTGEATVNQGANNIETLYGPIRQIYGPEEWINQQWENGGKGPYPVRVEKRPDFKAKHLNHCGKLVPLVIKWQTWKDTQTYETDPSPHKTDSTPAPEKSDPTPAAEKGDPSPKTGDPPGIQQDPTPTAPKGDNPGTGIEFPGRPTGGPQLPDVGSPGYKGPRDGSPNSTAGPGQVEAPSFLGHAMPGLPEGVDYNRAGRTAHEQFWLGEYGWTEEEFIRRPSGIDTLAVPHYTDSTPNEKQVGPDRWQEKLTTHAEYTVDEDGRVTSRPQSARGPMDFVDVPADMNPKYVFRENQSQLPASPNAIVRAVLAAKNAAGKIIDGAFALGSRLLTGGYASGWRWRLDYTNSITEPDLHFDSLDETGAAGAANVYVNGVQVATGSGSGDMTANGSDGGNFPEADLALVSNGNDTNAKDTKLKITALVNDVILRPKDADAVLYLETQANGAGDSGDISIEVGTATGTAGAISIGTGNASAITIGRTGINVSMPGTLSTGAHTQTLTDAAAGANIGSDSTNGPWETVYTKHFDTGGSGATETLIDIPVPTDSVATIHVQIDAIRSAAATKAHTYYGIASAYNSGGTATLIGSTVLHDMDSSLTFSVSFSASGGNLRVSVTDGSVVTRVGAIIRRTFRTTT